MPIGVGTAIYLEEYARKERWYNRLLEVNIQNLAAVPGDRLRHPRPRLHRARDRRRPRAPRRRPDPHARRPADRDHLLAGGAPGGARLDPPGRLCARRDEMAGDLAAGAAGLHSRHRDGLDPRALARGRRDGAAAPDRSADVRRVRSHDPRAVHRSAGADLHVGEAPRCRLPAARGGGDHRPARDRSRHECASRSSCGTSSARSGSASSALPPVRSQFPPVHQMGTSSARVGTPRRRRRGRTIGPSIRLSDRRETGIR